MKKFNLKVFLATWLAYILVLGGLAILGMTYVPILSGEVWYRLKNSKKQIYSLTDNQGTKPSLFSMYLSKDPIKIVPVNKEFSLVIEKINVNVPVVKNVPVVDEKLYLEALKDGVAQASGTSYPDEKGNVYIFAHSSVSFFNLGKYATAFNLLRKLEKGDKIHIFYKFKDYTYEVINKEIVKGWDTSTLTRKVIEPILTLQTCDPPGTTLNRLIVTSKLIEVK